MAAMVRNLVTGDVYYAEKGKGATKNGKRIATSKTSDIREAILGVDLSRTDEETYAGLARLITSAKRQVHFGANALELCFLAEGMIDAFVDVRSKTRIVDFAGGYLIAKEAGAVLSTRSGDELLTRLEMRERFSFVASANPQLHKAILDHLKERRP
jgi:myo-inositol-1(or 4)-monophosphatase